MARDFNSMWQQARHGERSGLFAAEDAYGQRFSGRHLSKGYGQKASSICFLSHSTSTNKPRDRQAYLRGRPQV
jgi:hypothetical protein